MAEPQDRPVSFFKQAAPTDDNHSPQYQDLDALNELYIATGTRLTLFEALNRARTNPQIAERIATLRGLTDKRERDSFKATMLPAITASAWYKPGQRRQSAGGYKHTGAVALDFDHVGIEAVDELRAAAMDVVDVDGYPQTITAFRSPSGDGVKCVVHISPLPLDAHEHVQAWEIAAAVYQEALGLRIEVVDASVKDVSRLCFLSSDPDSLVRPSRETRKLPWKQLAGLA